MSSIKNLDNKYYYEVAIGLGLKHNLIYSSDHIFIPGDCVIVSLRNKKIPAVILNKVSEDKKKSFTIKAILSVDKSRTMLSARRLKWLKWLASYYQYNVGQVVHLSFPPQGKFSKKSVKKDTLTQNELSQLKGVENPLSITPSTLTSTTLTSTALTPTTLTPSTFTPPTLTIEQKACLKSITAYRENAFYVHLLHGVTGSGKTEIYFSLIEPALKQGKTVLILVPEITLTPQHIDRFSERFPGKVACFHSNLSAKQKHKQWMDMLSGDKKILIGPRSALFCPLPNLAWIIVDEEHESLFKQEEKLKYHGRDAAVYLGKCLDIPVVLASATPSLESWWNAQNGKYNYHSLKKRVFNTILPRWEIVDMKKEQLRTSVLPYWLSRKLYQGIKQSLEQKQQVALFLNRRGERTYIFCSQCAYYFSCVNCDISLTQHFTSHLLCHYCGFRQEKPETCPQCAGEKIISFGVGTALLETEIKKLLPSARIVRADRDEITTYKQWEEILNKMEKQEVDILIGTQMISKGLDFSHLNLVGFILADQGLSNPDFRSAEKSFQLITQMAGRSGRRKTPGQVILQTYNPSHPVIKAVKTGDYKHFAEQELKYRKKYIYPPFGKLSLVRVQSPSDASALKVSMQIKNHIKLIKNLIILGPTPAPHFKLRNKYRYHLLLKSTQSDILHYVGSEVSKLEATLTTPQVQIHINTDPVYMF